MVCRWSPWHAWESLGEIEAERAGENSAQLASLCKYFASRTPRSQLEIKDRSVTFHFRECDRSLQYVVLPFMVPVGQETWLLTSGVSYASFQAFNLHSMLQHSTANMPLNVLKGSMWVEVRPHTTGKAQVVLEIFERLQREVHPSELEPTPGSPTVAHVPTPLQRADEYGDANRFQQVWSADGALGVETPCRHPAAEEGASRRRSSSTDIDAGSVASLVPAPTPVGFVLAACTGSNITDEAMYVPSVPPGACCRSTSA